MFTATNTSTRLAAFSVALLMTVALHGRMLQTFDAVADNATMAQASQDRNVAVLEPVTVVGRRI
jgi:hypothetical protein